jgi:hypothetical protein
LLTQVYRETKPMEVALDTLLAHIESLAVTPRSGTSARAPKVKQQRS